MKLDLTIIKAAPQGLNLALEFLNLACLIGIQIHVCVVGNRLCACGILQRDR